MDKRWIYILIILIAGICTLQYIVDTSTTVGSAIVAIGTYTDTLPESYNIETSERDYAILVNRQTDEKIHIEDLGQGNLTEDGVKARLIELEDNPNITKINYTTEKYNDIILNTIKYEKAPANTTNKATLFMKFNHTFLLESYNYHDEANLDKGAHFVIDTLKQDYKETQDYEVNNGWF